MSAAIIFAGMQISLALIFVGWIISDAIRTKRR